MAHEVLPPLDYDDRTPRTEHRYLAAGMYGREFLSPAQGSVLNVAAGHTDLAGDLADMGQSGVQVVSLDPMYGSSPWYSTKADRVPGVAQEIPYDDNTFAATLCQYGLQHMAGQQSPAIREMVRVTRPVEDIHDNTGGTILLNPVFKVDVLTDAIRKGGLADVCGIQAPPADVRDRLAKPTLVIKKVPALTPDKIERLVEAIENTAALEPSRRSIGERLSRLVFRGDSSY